MVPKQLCFTMIHVRRSEDRGRTEEGWLESRHSFSFGNYVDSRHRGLGPLQALNEDRLAPGAGFPAHPHENIEIITVVLSGTLEHRDSLGNSATLHPGEVQCLTAGTGLRHSETNPDRARPVHLIQAWILPEQGGLPPGYAQKTFTQRRRPGALTLLASRGGKDGSLHLNQDVDLFVADVMPQLVASLAIRAGRGLWLQVTRGTAKANGVELRAGDGAALLDESDLKLSGTAPSEVLVFDVPWRSDG